MFKLIGFASILGLLGCTASDVPVVNESPSAENAQITSQSIANIRSVYTRACHHLGGRKLLKRILARC